MHRESYLVNVMLRYDVVKTRVEVVQKVHNLQTIIASFRIPRVESVDSCHETGAFDRIPSNGM